MLARFQSLFSFVAVHLLVLVSAAAALADGRHAAVVLSPKQNADVTRDTELLGRVMVRGWPVVLVQPDQANSPWYAQETVEPTKPGHFKARIRLGNDATPDDTRFRVVVLLLASADAAQEYSVGKVIPTLPEDAARSAEVLVTLRRETDPQPLVDILDFPRNGAFVGRVETVSGRISDEGHPIVLVRSTEPNGLWWVQQPCEPTGDGRFATSARFGNETTPAGSAFRILVLLAPKGRVADFQAGVALSELPRDIPCSREVQVLRQRDIQVPVND